MVNTSTFSRRTKYNMSIPPIPDITWLKLNGDILDYRGDNIGKTGATTTVQNYFKYSMDKSVFVCTGPNSITPPKIIRPTTFTFSCWMNVSAAANFARIFDFGGIFRLCFNNNTTIKFNDTYSLRYSTSFLNKWKHIAFTVSNTTLTVFDNGFPSQVITIVALVPNATLTLGYFFRSYSTNDPITVGSFSDIRLYGTVLTNLQMLGLYHSL